MLAVGGGEILSRRAGENLERLATLTTASLPALLDREPEPNVATFSPEDRAALHAHLGAYPVGRFENGRPHHTSPHVVLMRYRGFASRQATRQSHDMRAVAG